MPRLKKRADGRYQSKIFIGHDEFGKSIYKFVYAKSQTELKEKAEQAKINIQQKLSRTHYIDSDTYPLGN